MSTESSGASGVDQEKSTARTTDAHPAIERAIDATRARSTLNSGELYGAFRHMVKHGELPFTCPKCRGTGVELFYFGDDDDAAAVAGDCPRCRGLGEGA